MLNDGFPEIEGLLTTDDILLPRSEVVVLLGGVNVTLPKSGVPVTIEGAGMVDPFARLDETPVPATVVTDGLTAVSD